MWHAREQLLNSSNGVHRNSDVSEPETGKAGDLPPDHVQAQGLQSFPSAPVVIWSLTLHPLCC